jgi:hypothetical protein
MSLEKLIESHYAPKKGNDLLIKLIESKLNEAFGTDELTLAVGAGKSEYREEFEMLLTTPLYNSITSEKYFSNRLDTIKKYLNPKNRVDLRTDEFVATFIFLQEFDKILREYESEDPRQAGFKFETLFTVLFRGIQLNGSDITDAEILEPRAFARFSYKFYSESRRHRLDGSLHNLLRMMSENKEVVYFVCLKNLPASKFRFYSFLVTPDNFYSILKRSTDVYNRFLSDFQAPDGIVGQELASLMLDHMIGKSGGQKIETSTELFDRTFLDKVYNLTSLGQNLPEYNNTLCSFEGEIMINTAIISDAKNQYKQHELGRVGKLLEDVNKLNKQMLYFFATSSGGEDRTNIIDTINDIDVSFKEITK